MKATEISVNDQTPSPLDLEQQASNDDVRGSGYVSSEHSLSSAEHQSVASVPLTSDRNGSQENISGSSGDEMSTGEESHTTEIIRQVQLLLFGTEKSVNGTDIDTSSKASSEVESQSRLAVVTSDDLQQDSVAESEDPTNPVTPRSEQSTSNFPLTAYMPVIEDQNSMQDEEKNRRRGRCRALSFLLLCLLIVGLVLALLYFLTDVFDSTGSRAYSPIEPTASPTMIQADGKPLEITASPLISKYYICMILSIINVRVLI